MANQKRGSKIESKHTNSNEAIPVVKKKDLRTFKSQRVSPKGLKKDIFFPSDHFSRDQNQASRKTDTDSNFVT